MPLVLEPLELPFLGGHEPLLLSRQGNPRETSQAEKPRVLGYLVNPEQAADIVEIHVARLHNGPVQVDGAVPFLLPAPECMVPEREGSVALEFCLRGYCPFLKRRNGHYHLECRAGRILARY